MKNGLLRVIFMTGIVTFLAPTGAAWSETVHGQVGMVNAEQNKIQIIRTGPNAGEEISLRVPQNARLSGIRSLDELEAGETVRVEVEGAYLGEKRVTRLETGPMPDYTWGDKLSRGVVNVFTSPIEIPRQIDEVGSRRGAGQAWTVGVVQGFGRTALRIGAGLLEAVTFPFDFPNERKAPIVEPAYAWQNWPADVAESRNR